MYINDIFNGVNDVYVTGLGKWIPGLLFADDAVVLSESSFQRLKIKVVLLNTERAHPHSYNGNVTIISNYYTSDKLQIALDVITKWSYIHAIFLKNQLIPTAIKLKVLQSVLIPIGTYGGELFGMSESRIKPIQIIADRALRVIAGANRATAMSRLREEFGIKSINSVCSRLRERSHFKWPSSKTWIADLIRCLLKSRSSIWVSGTLGWQKIYNCCLEQSATRIGIYARNSRND
ncbi:hypothetical protein BB561_005499 [Smittium simulii]|uniref:Reverse transcriptase domain-containing protein n=1 Tax=Smittium simulii TaxID=133385 RepID=A0A2T9YA03_9FUNG|nr:hypothetical protein BB561_005499 [Smittium simulii]